MKIAGFGFRTSASADSLHDALRAAGGPKDVGAIATASEKATSKCLLRLSHDTGLPIHAIPHDRLNAVETATQSAESLAAHGTGSVAEAAALAAAGDGARLVQPRSVSADRMATCAIAIGDPQ